MVEVSSWTFVMKAAVGRSTTMASTCLLSRAWIAASLVSKTAVSVVGLIAFVIAS